MSDRLEPPKWDGYSRPLWPGINTNDKEFWLKVTDADGYPWDVIGRYAILDGQIFITALSTTPADETAPPKDLSPELYRRLGRQQPIKAAIRRQEIKDAAKTRKLKAEAEASGRRSPVLERWAVEYEETMRALKPWRSRYPDSDWAEWAEDYLGRVETYQSSYGILREIATDKSWGTKNYETVRARFRKMRLYEWVVGEGHLVEAGPRLLDFHNTNSEGGNDAS